MLLAIFAAAVGLLDAVSAVLVFALLAMLSSPGQGLVLPLVGDVSQFFPGMADNQLLLVGAVVVASIFLIRALAYLVQIYIQQRVAHHAGAEIATHLVANYLAMPYSFHLQRNSAELVRNAFDALQRLVSEVLLPMIQATSQALIVLAIMSVLFATAPIATLLVVAVFGPTVWLLLRIVHPRLKRFGRLGQNMARSTLKSLQQGFGGMRDIKLLGRADHFVEDFRSYRFRLAHARYIRGAISELPRTTIETVLVVFVVAFVGLVSLREQSPQSALAVLGLFGYSAFRVLPALTTILRHVNSLKFAGPTIDDVYEDFVFFEGARPEAGVDNAKPLSFRHKITLEDVWFRYEGAPTDALQGLTLNIPHLSSLGIVGPTGGGKTTLVDIVCGLLEPIRGAVRVDGCDIHENLRGWQDQLGVVPQSIFLLDDTLRRNIAFGLPDDEIDDERLTKAVRLAQLEAFIASLPEGFDTIVGERGVRISGGQRQRVAIARALYHDPNVLIFDEATSALDAVTEREFMAGLTDRLEGRTIIMVAHRITTVRDCDRIVVVDGGRVVDAGTYAELLERSPAFRELATGTL